MINLFKRQPKQSKPTIASLKEDFGIKDIIFGGNISVGLPQYTITERDLEFKYVDFKYSYGKSNDFRKLLKKHTDEIKGQTILALFSTYSEGALYGEWGLYIATGRKTIS